MHSRSLDALRLRPAAAADYDAFVRLFPELKTGEQPATQEVWARDIVPSTVVLEDAGRVVAYAYCQHLGAVARLRHIVVDPALRGRGVGRLLMERVAERARQAGCTAWELNVLPANTAARALYESLGMKVDREGIALRILWTQGDVLPSRKDLSAREAQPSEDRALESQFALTPGLLERLRAAPHMHLLVAEGARGLEGFAAFGPEFPGALPFVPRSLEAAGVLLRAMRPFSRPGFDWVRIVLEDDAAVANALIVRGARVHLRTLHMTGPL